MKKALAFLCTMLLVAGAYAFNAVVNEKVLQTFKQTFNSAEEVKWEEFKDYYSVSFVQGGIRAKVNYDHDGNMLSSLRYYAPEMLPLHVLGKLKKDYPKKSLYGVTEVTSGTQIAYYVKIQDEKNWYTIKIDASGQSEVYEKYKKA